LEDALKGSPQFKDFERCFSGEFVNQTIPKEMTDRFKARSQPDTFVKVGLTVRGMESIEQSLADLVKDEVMDGANKVEFEDGDEKIKLSSIRRMCFRRLPNVLILHLKRFDLDYTTFETVKLNSRCAFPTRLNMLPFTLQGIEAKELLLQRELQLVRASHGRSIAHHITALSRCLSSLPTGAGLRHARGPRAGSARRGGLHVRAEGGRHPLGLRAEWPLLQLHQGARWR
jgi:hypothetical protein